jgi:sec-independent protein translocase protein TatA
MLGTLGGTEIFIIGIVAILLFGATKVPEMAKALGRSVGEFKKGKTEVDMEIKDLTKDLKEASKL